MDNEIKANIADTMGYFRCVIKRPDGSIKVDTGLNSNMIMDIFKANILRYNSNNSNILLGNGSGQVTSTDTDLFNQIADSGTITMYDVDLPADIKLKLDAVYGTAYLAQVKCVTYGFNNLNNVVISEIGVKNYIYNYPPSTRTFSGLIAHSLIKDKDGNPITLNVLSGETLNIKYYIVIVVPLKNWRGSFTLKTISDYANPDIFTTETYDYSITTFMYNRNGNRILDRTFKILVPNSFKPGDDFDFDKYTPILEPRDPITKDIAIFGSENTQFNPLAVTHITNSADLNKRDFNVLFPHLTADELRDFLYHVQGGAFYYNNTNFYDYKSDPARDSNLSFHLGRITNSNSGALTFNSVSFNNGYDKNTVTLGYGVYINNGFKLEHSPYTETIGPSDHDNGIRGYLIPLAYVNQKTSRAYTYLPTNTGLLVLFRKQGDNTGIVKPYGYTLNIPVVLTPTDTNINSVSLSDYEIDIPNIIKTGTQIPIIFNTDATATVKILTSADEIDTDPCISIDTETKTMTAIKAGSQLVKVVLTQDGKNSLTLTYIVNVVDSLPYEITDTNLPTSVPKNTVLKDVYFTTTPSLANFSISYSLVSKDPVTNINKYIFSNSSSTNGKLDINILNQTGIIKVTITLNGNNLVRYLTITD